MALICLVGTMRTRQHTHNDAGSIDVQPLDDLGISTALGRRHGAPSDRFGSALIPEA
jgi:hypothetical protein